MLFYLQIDKSIFQKIDRKFSEIDTQKIEMHISIFDVLHIDSIIMFLQSQA